MLALYSRNDRLSAGGSLRKQLASDGWAVVADVPRDADNAALLELAGQLGTVRRYGAHPEDTMREGDAVHRVASYAVPMRIADASMLSTTSAPMVLHTDEAFMPAPSRYVLLHCWEPDPGGGGTSLLAAVERVLDGMEPWAIEACFGAKFRWREHDAPILRRVAGLGWPAVRYNLREIRGDAIGDDEDPRLRALPEIFADAATRAAVPCALRAGDCLVIDNSRVMHGRTGFDFQSPRLLKRVRVRTPAPERTRQLSMKRRKRSNTSSGASSGRAAWRLALSDSAAKRA